MELSKTGFVLLFVSSTILCAAALQKPKDISEEMYCVGCQATVKELDFILSHKPTRGMGETVTRALRKVCDVHNFEKYEYDAKKVNTVCKHIRGDEGMEAVLITEYNRKHKTGKQATYIDMTQMICGTVLKACHAPGTLGDEEGGSITYDPNVEDFYVKHGKNVRVANPVKQETPTPSNPNQTSPDESKDETVTETKESNSKNDLHEEL